MSRRNQRGDHGDRKELEALARRYGFHPKRRFSQNFLLRRDVVTEAVEAAGCGEGDWVLEIGAGFGVLTEALLESGATVTAFEIDRSLCAALHDRFASQKRLTVIGEDFFRWFREHREAVATRPYTIVSNLPYHISSHFFETVLSADSPPRAIVVLLQKELAERIAADPGNWSLLTLSVRIFGSPEYLITVPRTAFWPQPDVDSALLAVRDIRRPQEPTDLVFRLARMAFSNRRKQLHNSLAAGLQWSEEKMQEIFVQSKLSPAVRPQELDLLSWLRLAHAVSIISRKEPGQPSK